MRRFLLGTLVGLFIGWVTVPVIQAAYDITKSDHAVAVPIDNDDLRDPHAYKWYLVQILMYMRSMDATLKTLNTNIEAVKDKLHA